MPTVAENEKRFEELGFEAVKTLLANGGLPQHIMLDATQWVARRAEEQRQTEIESESEAKQIARDALTVARDTLTTTRDTLMLTRSTLRVAWVAAIAAMIGIVIALLAWLLPRA